MLSFEVCEKLDFLIPIYGEDHKKNLKRIKRKGKESLIN
jgi:hypothetical protein